MTYPSSDIRPRPWPLCAAVAARADPVKVHVTRTSVRLCGVCRPQKLMRENVDAIDGRHGTQSRLGVETARVVPKGQHKIESHLTQQFEKGVFRARPTKQTASELAAE